MFVYYMNEFGYEFYMQECDKRGVVLAGSEAKSIERDFGLSDGSVIRYSRLDGIEELGTPKNVYSESYADADRLRVYAPKDVKHKATTVTLTLFFVGDSRYKLLDEFNAYVKSGFHRYWDTARGKWFAFYVGGELKPAVQMWYGSVPYLKMDYKLTNIFGRTFDIEE